MTWGERFQTATAPGPNQITPGAVVMAADGAGNIIHSEARGVTSVEPDRARPMTVDTPLWVASCTKLLTTIATLQMVEQGKLRLDMEVNDLLPEVGALQILTGFGPNKQPQLRKPAAPITVHHLLTQQSGMTYDFLDARLRKWRELRGEEMLDWEWPVHERCTTPLVYEPGQGWAYSVSIDWAGKLVERLNGNCRLGDYMRKHIFEPLGMTMVTFRPLEHDQLRAQLPDATERSSTGKLVPTQPYFRGPNQDPGDDLGGGGLYCTPAEFLKVLVSLLADDEKLLRSTTVKKMFTPQLKDPRALLAVTRDPELGPMVRAGVASEDWQYGYGGTLHTADVPGVCRRGTLSWQGMPNCYWWIDRASATCGLYMSQLMPAGDGPSMDLAIDFRREIFRRANASI
ncbi:putative penicillin-binding protein [Aspergillus japonicus CBS 114.51]|uniref:Putative penicillin-binding protein n=1 Tax=Aspergillus japonicus CBS 114.51 TaxID=1448312 RepID=A0A8T8WJA3_ASPJA|nr:putative penicillin-binding protein [Aspergillus japonicus CBS 114.51]RAH75783.1 putative penicillin-binding protein [Aspergillus japonicus CBS 114.51]